LVFVAGQIKEKTRLVRKPFTISTVIEMVLVNHYLMNFIRSGIYFSLSLLLTSGFIAPSHAEERLRTISVIGLGSVSIPANLTEVSLGLEVTGKNPDIVQQEANDRAAKVINLLRQRRVEKLRTKGITIAPNYNDDNNRRKIISYTATNVVSFRTNTIQAGGVIDDAIKVGATKIDSVSSTADDAAIERAQTQALQLATKDAQRQARSVLEAIGLKAKEIAAIQVNDAAPPSPIITEVLRVRRLPAGRDGAPPLEIIGGDQDVSAKVTFQILY
jgi:uncharacterized protein